MFFRRRSRGGRLVQRNLGLSRRVLRATSALIVLTFALVSATQSASATELALKPVSLAGPMAFLRGLFATAPTLPGQGRGRAAVEASTKANHGSGAAAKPGPGQLTAYTPTPKKTAPGRSGAVYHGFDAKTSKRLPARSTAHTTWWQNADGSLTERLSQGLVNYRDSSGGWQPIDASLAKGADGRLHQKANGFDLSLADGSGPSAAARMFAGPGSTRRAAASAQNSSEGDLVDLSLGSGEDVAWSLSGAAQVGAALSADGTTTSYPGILPATTLQLTSENYGVKESIVLASPSAPNSWTFPLALSGVSLSQEPSGVWQLIDGSGNVAATLPLPEASDANVDPHTGLAPTTTNVNYALSSANGTQQLTMTLDPAWLNDPARVFPVTVDPTVSVSINGQQLSTYVDTQFPDQNYLTYSGEWQYIKLGNDSAGDVDFGFLDYPSGVVNTGYNISAASFAAFDQHAWNTANTYGYDVDAVACTTGSAMCWSPGGITYTNRPQSIQTTLGSWSGTSTSMTCGGLSGRWEYTTLNAGYMNNYSARGQYFYGLQLVAGSLSDSNYWKILDSSQVGGCSPYLSLTYTPDAAPQIDSVSPQDGTPVNTLTPQLTVAAHDPDGFPNPLSYYFAVYPSTGGSAIADSGPGYQSSAAWSVPAGKLAWGKTYQWYVCAFDGYQCETAPQWNTFTTTAPPPVLTGGLSQDSDGHGFSASLGNYTASATDATVSVVGPPLAVVRDYNSLDSRTGGAFGAAWSSTLDAKASQVLDATGKLIEAVVTYPDGSQVVFAANGDGSFAPPAGRYATFVAAKNASGALIGYVLTDKSGMTYTFEQTVTAASGTGTAGAVAGVYGISAVADRVGRALSFSYASQSFTLADGSGGTTTRTVSVATTETSAVSGGRALHFTWFAPSGATSPHVRTVATDEATAGDPTTSQLWTYQYTGDQLTGRCAPSQANASVSESACTAYTYGTLSDYQNGVLDGDPSSYWPLSDPANSTAAQSRAAGKAGTDVGTYTNVTLGSAGSAHLTGSGATTASFTATSKSYVTLPSSLLVNRSYLSVALWFETTTTGQILFSEQNTAMGSTPSNATASLYIGTDGKLYGAWYTGSIKAAVSKNAVADGKWHFVVLSGSGNVQMMYLDGTSSTVTQSGDTGTITNLGQSVEYVGAGYSSGVWPNEPAASWNYFTGSISDVSFYTRGLTSTEAFGLNALGTNAGAFLTKITRPSGAVAAQVSYDSVTGRVTGVTDANGASWSLSAPTSTGSDQVYKAAVLAQAPESYWRFGDPSGTTNPIDQINDDAWSALPGPATYNNVGLGSAGVFPGAAAASFNGTDSQVALPSGVLDNHVAVSVSMWFKTANGATNGVLFSHSAAAVSAGSTTGNYQPWLYVGSDGKLVASVGPGGAIESAGAVNSGAWHHVVFAVSSGSQALYLDGALVGTSTPHTDTIDENNIYVGAGYLGGTWPDQSNNGASTALLKYFNGFVSDVAIFDATLSDAQASELWQGYKSSLVSVIPVTKVTVTDPVNSLDGTAHTEAYYYDPLHENRLVRYDDALGGTTTYGYDTAGFLNTVTDPNGDQQITGHDVRGNIVSRTTCQYEAQNKCQTSYYQYYPDDTSPVLPYPIDPRDDVLTAAFDPRSSSTSDDTYRSTYFLNAYGDSVRDTTPPVPGFPSGRVTGTTFTDGTSAYACGSQNVVAPKDLVHVATSPGGAVTTTSYYANGDACQVTDANGEITRYTYDGLGRMTAKTVVSDTYPSGLTTSFDYDGADHVKDTTAPTVTDYVITTAHRTAVTSATYDVDGNMLTQTVTDTGGIDAPRTVYYSYNHYDQKATSADARSANAADTTYQNRYTYDAFGNVETKTDPLGRQTQYLYDGDDRLAKTQQSNTAADTTASSGSTLVLETRSYDPAGRLASTVDAQNYTTNYLYYDDNQVYQISKTDSGGHTYVVEQDTYDAADNLIKRLTNNAVTESDYTVDAAGRTVRSVVDPAGADRTASVSYSADDQILSATTSAASGSSSTDYTYDASGNVLSQSVEGASGNSPSGWWKLNQSTGDTVADSSGTGGTGVLSPSGAGWASDAATFDGTGVINTVDTPINTATSYSVSAWVNFAAAPTTYSTVVGAPGSHNGAFYLQYSPASGGWAFVTTSADVSGETQYASKVSATPAAHTWYHLVGVYNATAKTIQLYVDGAAQPAVAQSAAWSASQGLSIGGAGAGNFVNGQVGNVQVYQRVLSQTDVNTLYGQGNGRTAGALGTSTSTTAWARDQRGLPTSVTDADGNTTLLAYDEAGRLAQTTSPRVTATTVDPTTGAAAQSAGYAITSTGYDTFGDVKETSDALGNETINGYDAAGNKTATTAPPYTPPGASNPIIAKTIYQYDPAGELTAVYDPVANQVGSSTPTAAYTYTNLGLKRTTTDAAGNVSTYGYNSDGQLTSTTVTSPSDSTGVKTGAVYDYLGRVQSSTQIERYPSVAPAYETDYNYADTGGWLSSARLPSGNTLQSYAYDNLGEKTQVTDANNDTTTYGYDFAGRVTRTTLPDQSYSVTAYDALGDATSTTNYDKNNTLLASASATYDAAGHPTSSTDAMGSTTSYSYDPTGLLTGETQQACAVSAQTPTCDYTSISVWYGYDLDGHQTAYAGGNAKGTSIAALTDTNHTTYTTYNSWGLPESTIEPPASASTYTAITDRATTNVYDPDGRLSTQNAPGGVSTGYTYNPTGTLASESGIGAEAATATRSFTYDAFGDVTTASTSNTSTNPTSNATSESFSYDDRGHLLTTSGSAGSSTFTYTPDGLMASRQDAAGTTGYGYDNQDRLQSLTDPLTGTDATYTYTPQSQVSTITYGAGGDVRTYGYDTSHRLTSDTLTSGTSKVKALSYGYDPDSHLISKTDAAGVANTYTYDLAGRLTSWNNGTVTTQYAYDSDSNRTQVGANVYTYDQRDELTSDGTNTYTYTARGTLTAKSVTGTGANVLTYTADAYGRQIGAGAGTYLYDATGRLLSRTTTSTTSFQYSGVGSAIASDGSEQYSHTPAGGAFAVDFTATNSARLLATDLHTDVVGDFTATGTSMVGVQSYDPLGNVLTRTGSMTSVALGYQSQYSDSTTGQTDMGARWYNPATGQFTSKDSVTTSAVPNTANANPFGYADADPLTATDPSGHFVAVDPGTCDSGQYFDQATGSCTSPRPGDGGGSYNGSSGGGGTPASSDNGGKSPDTNGTQQDVVTYQDPEACATLLCYQQENQQIQNLQNLQSSFVDDAMSACATQSCFEGRSSIQNMLIADGGQYTDGKGIYTDAVAATVSSQTNAALKAMQKAEQQAEQAAKPQQCGWTHIGGCIHNAAGWVDKHPLVKSLVVGAVAVGSFLGCMAATGPEDAAGCGALSGMAANGLNYLIGAEATGKFSVGGLALNMAIGGLTGWAGASLGGLGSSVAGDLLGDASPAVASIIKGAVGGTVAGGVNGGGSYLAGCIGQGDCTLSGFGESVLGGALGGGVLGGVAGGLGARAVPEAGDEASTGQAAGCHSFTGGTQVLMADATKEIDKVKVGDQIVDSVPGQRSAQTHTVTNVITTYTDHDFVDIGIAPIVDAGTGTGTAQSRSGAAAVSADAAREVGRLAGLKKAAVGLAAALALVTSPGAGASANASAVAGTDRAQQVALASNPPVAPGHIRGATDATALGGVLTTTFHHPFYDLTQAAFVEAQRLVPGDVLQTPAGHARVTSIRLYHADTVTYDLTIGELHTYYVLAGSVAVLIHNCGNDAPRIFSVDSSGSATALPVHTIDSSLYPDVADNFNNALANGESPIVTRLTGRSAIRANRAAAQAGEARPGMLGTDVQGGALSWEEFPFASTYEGGDGATLRLINRTQNTSHGRDSLWPFLRDNGVNDGDQYYVQVG